MTFPETPLPIQVELMINGAWSDITSDVYSRDSIVIRRGRTAEGSTVDPGSCSLTLDNRDSKYSPRVPTSVNYGLIGRNTPIRVSVRAGASYLAVNGGNFVNVGASTPDATVIDITGDLDARIEATLDNWLAPGTIELCGKGLLSGNQRSWLLMMRDQRVRLEWSAGGTSTVAAASTAAPKVPPSGHLAVRCTLDVDNGASGTTVTFYTAPSITGPWTQLGAPVTSAGVTSLFNSTAPLMVGQGWSDLGFSSGSGRIHSAEVRNGMGGTVVANPNFTVQTPGTTSFTDTAGRAWSVSTSSTITNRQIRFVGEVSEWPLKWDPSGRDIYVTIAAAGILRRLSKGAVALDSTLRRSIPGAPNLVAYWPMEEGAAATRASSPVAGVSPLTLTNVAWASADTLPSSGPLPVLASNGSSLPMMSGAVPAPAGASTGWHVQWVYRLDSLPTTLWTFMRILTTGTVTEWYVQARDNLSRVLGKNSDGDTVVDSSISTGAYLFNQWTSISFRAVQSGGTVTWTITWQNVGGDALESSGTYTGTVGRVRGVASPPDGYAAALDGMALGHIGVFSTELTNAYIGSITAYAGETAGSRMLRLSVEEGAPVSVSGVPAEEAQLGPQRPSALLGLLQEAADADHGILYENREATALTYLGLETLYNQDPVQLTYATDLMPGLEPIDDDQTTENDVTVTRQDGSSGRAVLDVGALSVQPPPLGVGTYSISTTLNLFEDSQTASHAGWVMHLGTVDEPRYPTANLSLARNPELIDRVLALDSGVRLQILNPPAKLPPGAIDLIVQGYTETLSQYVWDVTPNCTPASPYTVGVLENPDLSRADTTGSALATAAASSATTMVVTTTAGPRWVDSVTYPGEFPFNVRVGGEIVTVTGIAAVARDAFGRTTSSTWGTADSGQVWTSTGGSTADFTVVSGQSRHTCSTTNVARLSVLPKSHPGCDITVSMAANALSTGASQFACVLGRYTDANNFYYARLEFATTGAITLTIRKRVAGTDTELGSQVMSFTHVAGRMYGVRLQVSGSGLRAWGWDTVAGVQPLQTWTVQATDTALTTGNLIGCRSIVATANTNVSPVIAYDAFTDQAPQIFTVIRAVNGVHKAQLAGADVRLATPTVVAL